MWRRLLIAALLFLPNAAIAGSLPLLHVGVASNSTPTTLQEPLFGTFRLGTAATAIYGAAPGTDTGAEQNSVSTTSTVRRVPIPFPATISHLHSNLTVAPTGTDTVTDSITNTAVSTTPADGTVTCTYAVVSGTTNNCFDDTHTDTLGTGYLFDAHFTVSDSQTQSTPGQLSWILTATNNQYVALINQANASGNFSSSATLVYIAPGSGGQSATESTISFQFCPTCGGTILGFFLVPNVTETGTHTWTVYHNGSPTSMTFNTSSATTGGGAAGQCISPNGSSDTIGGGTVVNHCTSNSGLTFTVAPGDTISVAGNCPAGTGCATAIPGFSIIYSPNTSGVVPLSSTASQNNGTATPGYYGASSFTASTTQVNYQQIPAAMTFSSYQQCALTVASAGTKTTVLQVGATPGTVPTTPGTTLSASYTTSGGACPTDSTFLSGAEDLTHSVSVTEDETVDSFLSTTGTTGTQTNKVSMQVVVSGGSVGAAQVPGPSATLYAAQTYYTCTSNKYVSTTGNSGNTGNSTGSPWDIVTASTYAAPAGTCINYAAGDYTSVITTNGGIGLTHGGTGPSKTGYVVHRCSVLSATITGGTISGEGTGCVLGVSSGLGTKIFDVASGTSYLMVDGFEFAGTPSVQASCFNIDFGANTSDAATAHHIWSLNNDIHSCGNGGIAWNYTDWLFAIHNLIHDNGSTNPDDGSGLSFYQPAGLSGYTPTSGNPDYWHSTTTGYTYDMVIAYNVGVRNYNHFTGATDGEGIIMDTFDWSGTCSSQGHGAGICPFNGYVLIMGNIMWGNGGEGIEVFSMTTSPASTAHLDVINNTMYSNAWDQDVSPGGWSGQMYTADALNTRWWNNLAISVTGTKTCDAPGGISGVACTVLDQSNTATITYGTNMSYVGSNTFFDGTNSYPLTGTNHNLDGTNPNLTSLTPLTSTTGTIAGNFVPASGSAAIGFGQAFDLFQVSGSIDAGACSHTLTNCP